jgi:hypothetical protein
VRHRRKDGQLRLLPRLFDQLITGTELGLSTSGDSEQPGPTVMVREAQLAMRSLCVTTSKQTGQRKRA